MKKLFISLLAAVALTASAFATTPLQQQQKKSQGPVSAQSVTVSVDSNNFSYLFLNDGLRNSFSAISLKLYSVPTVPGLSVNGIGAVDSSNGNRVYAGTGLAYTLPTRILPKGFSVQLIAGLKGFDLSDGAKFSGGKSAFVYGFGLTIPLGK